MRVRNVASGNPIYSDFPALRIDLCQGALARHKTSRSPYRLLRALPHLGSLVRNRFVSVHGDQLFLREMASAKPFRGYSLYRYSAEFGAARNVQVPAGDRDQHSSFVTAKILPFCLAVGNFILDVPGNELSL